MNYLVTEYGLRQQSIVRTMIVDIPEELAEQLGRGHELDRKVSVMADEMGVSWEAVEDDIWDEADSIDIDEENVGDQYDGHHNVLAIRSSELGATSAQTPKHGEAQ